MMKNEITSSYAFETITKHRKFLHVKTVAIETLSTVKFSFVSKKR